MDLVLQICEVDGAIPLVDGDFNPNLGSAYFDHGLYLTIYIGNVD